MIQREPLAEVKVKGVTHLRKSNQGLSLAYGQNYAVVRSPETVTIDLGDAWQSRLGRNRAISTDAQHTWYRVVRHDGRPVRDDVYIREGSFREVSRPPSQMGHVTVLRFCNVDDPKTMWSHGAKEAGEPGKRRWQEADITEPHMLRRAGRHMDGAIAHSPFVSVAEDEQSLLRFGYSGGLKSIVFGAEKPEEQAPHIAVFSVPAASLISPEMIRAGVPEAHQLLGIARAEKETERLYYGDDIRQHLIRYKHNPYRREHLDQIIEQQPSEEPSGAIPVPAALQVRSLDMGKVKAGWLRFSPILEDFLSRIGKRLTDYPGLDPGATALVLRTVFRKIEAAFEALGALNEEWIKATDQFRMNS